MKKVQMRRVSGVVALAVLGIGLPACGNSGSSTTAQAPSTPSPSSPSAGIQQVSDDTTCDLLFRDNGVMVKSVALMSKHQTSLGSARQARAYAQEADRIASRASDDLTSKIEALSSS